MIKKIFALLTLLTIGVAAWAAKSVGKPFTVQQSDGTTLTIRLLGDEHFNWYQTTDGVLLLRQDKGYYVAETLPDGSLRSTGILAHAEGERNAIELSLIHAQQKALFHKKEQEVLNEARTVFAGYPDPSRFSPHSGNLRIPIILMNYTDVTFTSADPKAVFEEYFNGTAVRPYSSATKLQGYSSVRQFFTDASHGNFTPQFDLYGPYTASQNHDYYGNNTGRSYNLLREAVQLAEGDIDFTQYDSDNNGKVDIVYVLYAGTGANTSQDNRDFWPACWYNSSIRTNSGKVINVIGGSNELAYSTTKNPSKGNVIAGVGVFCHEMSHGLGLPDLYWTSGTPQNNDYNNCGPEDWDLMDGGENLSDGLWPCQYAAWEREILGWLEAEELNAPADVTVYPLNDERGKAYKVVNPSDPMEYYIIENLASDEWNYYLNKQYGCGLMITHLNHPSEKGMSPNNTYGKPNITILPADGFILGGYSVGEWMTYNGERRKITWADFDEDAKGDPYPGSHNVTALAAYKNYTGTDMVADYPITDIRRNADGSISFKFMGGAPSPDPLNGDVNNDGVVDISDINAIITVICGQ